MNLIEVNCIFETRHLGRVCHNQGSCHDRYPRLMVDDGSSRAARICCLQNGHNMSTGGRSAVIQADPWVG